MNLRSIDLNLLVIFDALMAEKSLSAAARKVGMTPSAASHALNRLRRTFNDPLIERTPHGMQPTRRARDLIEPIHAALAQLERSVSNQLDFDPATAERTFNIRISDFMVACLLPRLCARVRVEAPGVMLVVDHLPSGDKDPYQAGDIQLRVDTRVTGAEYRKERIWRDRFVAAMRRGHPAAEAKLTLERFLSLPYLSVSGAVIDTRPLDDVLDSKGLRRRIVVTVPSMAVVVPILAYSDLCTILPERWIALYAGRDMLAATPLPLKDLAYVVDMVWHRADDRDGGHRWLRTLISHEFAALYAPVDGDDRGGSRPGPDRLDRVPVTPGH
jgi:DNA-binding transcriptional LysR family regulator